MSVVIPEETARTAEGPYFDELAVGQVFGGAPGVTLTSGHAATHQSIVGDRLTLPLDEELSRAVTGQAPSPTPPWSGTWRSASPRWPPIM